VATVDSAITSFLANHLRELAKLYELTIITNTSNPALLSEIGVDANLIRIKFSRKISLAADFYCLLKLVQIFMGTRFASIHSITPKAGLLAMLAAYLTKVSLRVHTFTGQVWALDYGFRRLCLKTTDKLIGALTTHNIVDSHSQLDFLVKQHVLHPDKASVFGSGSVGGVDLTRFKKNIHLRKLVRKELSLPNESFVFLYLGRLTKDKGVLDLAHAFSKIQDANTYLIFIGPDEDDYSSQIKIICSKKMNNIRLIGFTKIPYKLLSAADVLCLPSYREGFGSVIIEAAAMQIPSLGSNIYGIKDAIKDMQTGLLHEAGNISDIKKTMEVLLKDRYLLNNLGRQAKARAVYEFDANILSKIWLKFYKKNLR
jgi:glycosyltransferase involved in cell wall biosynthesis